MVAIEKKLQHQDCPWWGSSPMGMQEMAERQMTKARQGEAFG